MKDAVTVDDEGNVRWDGMLLAKVRPGTRASEIQVLRDNNTSEQQTIIDNLNRRLKEGL